MKKLLSVAVLFSYILFGSILNAKNITIGNDLSVPIPPNYKTFQIDVKKIYKAFNYSHSSNDLNWLKELGLDGNLDILIFSTSSKNLQFYKDFTNQVGVKKLIKYYEQALEILDGEDFEKLFFEEIKQSGVQVEKMSKTETQEFVENLMSKSSFQKKFYSLFLPLINKLDKKYEILSGTTSGIILSNKKIPKDIYNLINNKSSSALKKDIKNWIKTAAKEDITFKPYTNWDFEVKKKNKGEVYFYSDDSFPEANLLGLDPKQEIYISTYNKKLLIAWTSCLEKNCIKKKIFNMMNFPN